ncbi:hypothetical protein [Paraurantiacibacter namhicola]|uniref:hypothetical protein n=1 Tax=Paraurantiacibacter namhicola TaxID=645517 RepID=UPI00083450EC|nr:hypothetical protein [Paraurantiacibacter namhicola]
MVGSGRVAGRVAAGEGEGERVWRGSAVGEGAGLAARVGEGEGVGDGLLPPGSGTVARGASGSTGPCAVGVGVGAGGRRKSVTCAAAGVLASIKAGRAAARAVREIV